MWVNVSQSFRWKDNRLLCLLEDVASLGQADSSIVLLGLGLVVTNGCGSVLPKRLLYTRGFQSWVPASTPLDTRQPPLCLLLLEFPASVHVPPPASKQPSPQTCQHWPPPEATDAQGELQTLGKLDLLSGVSTCFQTATIGPESKLTLEVRDNTCPTLKKSLYVIIETHSQQKHCKSQI